MRDFVIITDTTCDLKEEFQKEYDIIVIPGHLCLPDKGEVLSFLNWDSISREEFYDSLKKNPEAYTTSPANVEELSAAFERYAKEGKDILSLSISSGISGAYGFSLSAKERVQKEYPDITIECNDTLRFGPAIGLMAIYASIMRKEGKDIKEVAEYLEENKNCFHQAGWLDDLSFVAKKGRITHASAFFGQLVGIKPIGEFDYNGLTTVIGKVKSAKTAYAALINYIRETIVNPEEQIIFIAQTNRMKQAEEYKKLIEDAFHPKAIYINDVFPSCGINIGPGLMAAYYIGKPISRDLETEKKILADFNNQ